MMKFEYFYGLQAEQYSFYRIPKVLFQAENFKGMSCESKVLYGLLLDRMDLSIKNRWFDEENRVYIIFSIEEVIDKLRCAKQKAVKLMAELDEIGLIEKKRIGFGKANVIYVKNFATEMAENQASVGKYENQTCRSMKIIPQEVSDSNLQKYENQTSRGMEIKLQEVLKPNLREYENQTSRSMKTETQQVCFSNPNQTELINTDFNNNQSYQSPKGKREAIEAYREIIHDNIDYEILCTQYGQKKVDEVVELMLEVITSKKKNFRIAGEEMDANLVKTRFMQIEFSHIQYAFTCLGETTTKVTNIKQYMMTVLYNATITMAHYYQNRVLHDMYGGK